MGQQRLWRIQNSKKYFFMQSEIKLQTYGHHRRSQCQNNTKMGAKVHMDIGYLVVVWIFHPVLLLQGGVYSLANRGVPHWFGELAAASGQERTLGSGLYTGGMQATCLPVTNGLVETQQAFTATCLCSDVSQSCGQAFSKSVGDTAMELRSPEVAHLGRITSEQLLVANKSSQTQCCGEHSLQGLGPYFRL